MILNVYKCAICNLVKKYGVKEKFRISHVPTAQLLSDAASAKQDDVHVRFADLQTPERLIAADMYCHSNCKRAFLHEFTEQNSACVFSDEKLSSSFKKALDLAAAKSILEGATKNGDEDLIQRFLQFYNQTVYSHAICWNSYLDPVSPDLLQLFKMYVDPLIQDMLAREYDLTLSDIREHISEHCPQTTLSYYIT